MNEVEAAIRNLEIQLNYGGVFVDGMHTHKHISLAFEQGEQNAEVAQMRRLASAFTRLANAVESK